MIEGGGPGTSPQPVHVTSDGNASVWWTYTPVTADGSETTTYWATDSQGARSADAAISVRVGPSVDRLPVCGWERNGRWGLDISMRAGATRRFGIVCSDLDGDPFVTPAVEQQPEHGVAVVVPGEPSVGSYWGYEQWLDATYTPLPGQAPEQDEFTCTRRARSVRARSRTSSSPQIFRDQNGGGGCAYGFGSSVTQGAVALPLLASCIDDQGDVLTAEVVRHPAHGLVTPVVTTARHARVDGLPARLHADARLRGDRLRGPARDRRRRHVVRPPVRPHGPPRRGRAAAIDLHNPRGPPDPPVDLPDPPVDVPDPPVDVPDPPVDLPDPPVDVPDPSVDVPDPPVDVPTPPEPPRAPPFALPPSSPLADSARKNAPVLAVIAGDTSAPAAPEPIAAAGPPAATREPSVTGQPLPLTPAQQARIALKTRRVKLISRIGDASVYTSRARRRRAVAVSCPVACTVRAARRHARVTPGRAAVLSIPRRGLRLAIADVRGPAGRATIRLRCTSTHTPWAMGA